jgi:hypothetical protein
VSAAEAGLPAFFSRASRGRVIVNRFEPGFFADGFGMMLFDVLGEQADLFLRRTFITEFDDVFPVEGFANGFDVLFQPLVGKEWRGLRRGGGRSRQRAGALRDVGEELRDLERVALLLEELVIKRGLSRLGGLLLRCAGAELRLGAG